MPIERYDKKELSRRKRSTQIVKLVTRIDRRLRMDCLWWYCRLLLLLGLVLECLSLLVDTGSSSLASSLVLGTLGVHLVREDLLTLLLGLGTVNLLLKSY